nr:A-kinase anchor protein 1, mitochondrial [Pogona vitticeps]
MALRFRTLLPFAIPGVLALIGWWWFSSRKKERVSNHDRRDPAGLEECRIGSPEDFPSNSELSLPPEAKLPVESAVALEPLLERQAPPPPPPEHREWSLGSSTREPPALAKPAVKSDVHQDDSEKLEVMGCQGAFGSPALQSSLPGAPGKAHSCAGEATVERKLDASRVAEEALLTAASLELPCVEKSRESREGRGVQNSPSESLKEGPCPMTTASSPGCVPTRCSEVAHDAVAEGPMLANKEMNEFNGGVLGAVEPEVRGAADQRPEPQSVDVAQETVTSSSNAGNMLLKHQGVGEAGCKGSLEKKKLGGISLDKEEVEKIEQVAIHIISNVIRAATEEVLSGSADCVSGRMCQMAGRTDRPPEKASAGAVGQGESGKENEPGAEKVAPAELPPPVEENISRPAVFSSHLTHGLLANPGHGQPTRDSVGHDRPVGDPATVTNHEEELEDIHGVTEDSGCSACASEDGASAEDLLKSTSSPPLQQRLDLLNMPAVTGLERHSASSKKPPSPTLMEDKVPYSNGMLKEDGPPLGHEQAWPGEADTDHSGGSDVNSMDSVDSGCAVQKNGSCQKSGLDSSKTELVIWEIEVPKHLVGRLIGKQGRYVSFLKQVSGAKIYISTLPYTQDFQICHIEGSQQNVDKALSLIGKKFKDLSLTNIYAPPPPPLPLHSLPMTSWLMLPDGVTVEVIVVNQVNAGHLFVQQHTHPTFHVLRSLDQQMYLCYSQPGIPTMPTPVEVGVVCAAPGVEGAWWRAQVVGYFKDTNEVEIRYVDYGGYERVKIDTLRQIRSDFVTLPFQGAEVLLDNVVPLPDDDQFSSEADTVVSEMTRGTPLLAQVTNYDSATGLPLIQLWSMIGDELVSINRTLVERGFAQWVESY